MITVFVSAEEEMKMKSLTLFFFGIFKIAVALGPDPKAHDLQNVITTATIYKGTGTTILVLYLMTDENARSFQVKKIRALKSALEMLVEKR